MLKTTVILLCSFCIFRHSHAQFIPQDSVQLNKKRVVAVSAANAIFLAGSFVALNKAWYADYERTGFHFFNDNAEWNQMDKAGHVWTTYQISRASAEAWKWTGLKRNSSALLGAATGILYQSVIELQDAYSTAWGFSWGDMGTNFMGAALFVLQETSLKQQKISIKMSYWPHSYDASLVARRNQLYGSSAIERVLKDYNSQTYWVSANISSFAPRAKIPAWLNIAVGYGAKGLLGGRKNVWTSPGGELQDFSTILRERRFYLSADVDLTRIRTNSKFLRTCFFVLNAVKVPAPALELAPGGTFRVVVK